MFRGIQRDGLAETLRRLDLGGLVGRPATDVFLALTEIVCGDQTGGPIDEAIARDAWLETVASFPEMGIADLENLDVAQMRDVFVEFVSHAVETRIMQDIGSRGLELPPSLAAIENLQAQLHDYIRLAVRDAFIADMGGVADLSDQAVRDVVDRTYTDAFNVLQMRGEEAA